MKRNARPWVESLSEDEAGESRGDEFEGKGQRRGAWSCLRRSLGAGATGGLVRGRAAVGGTEGIGSGGVVVAVAVASWGEEALDDAFEAGHAFGQGLHVPSRVGHVAADLGKVSADFRSQALVVGANFGQAGIDFGAKTLAAGSEFTSQGLVVGTRVAADREQQADHCGVYANLDGADGEDADEFGGDGRLLVRSCAASALWLAR